MICDMKQLDRRTVNFAPGEASFLDLYKEPDTPEHLALHTVLPDATTDSDSNIIKALIRVAHIQLREEAMRLAYDRAVDSGEFDAESRAAMRRSRKTVSSIAAEAE
jgi:hypothetical protein